MESDYGIPGVVVILLLWAGASGGAKGTLTCAVKAQLALVTSRTSSQAVAATATVTAQCVAGLLWALSGSLGHVTVQLLAATLMPPIAAAAVHGAHGVWSARPEPRKLKVFELSEVRKVALSEFKEDLREKRDLADEELAPARIG